MKGLTLRTIVRVTGGALHLDAPEDVREKLLDTEISSVTTDSRKVETGALFGAIVGSRVDGHTFASDVFGKGALCVLAERELTAAEVYGAETGARAGSDTETGARAGSGPRPWILVDNTIRALGQIAREYLDILNIPVVGITGSVGKTSTKEMIASVLSVKFRTMKTEGNFNNGLGLPLSIFRLTEETEIAVLEMGISHFGDMDELMAVVSPDTCVITNIGVCHLEFLKDRDGVFKEKSRMLDFIRPGGHIVLNGNDDKLRQVAEVGGIRPVFFGVETSVPGAEALSAGPVVTFPDPEGLLSCVTARDLHPIGFEGTACTLSAPAGDIDITVPVPGLHNVSNAACAAAVGLGYGMSLEEIRKGIEAYQTIGGRFNVQKTEKLTVIDDCYNANPVSMKASLATLKEVKGSRRVAILGDMGELGEEEVRLHEDVGICAARCADVVLTAGRLSENLSRAAAAEAAQAAASQTAAGAGAALTTAHFATVEELIDHLDEIIKDGDTVLVKASHSMEFPRIVKALMKDE